MTLSDQDRMEVLQLLSESKITVEEAARLLSNSTAESASSADPEQYNAVEEKETGGTVQKPVKAVANKLDGGGGKPKWFHVRVSDLKTGEGKVTVNIPLSLVKAGLNLGGRYSKELSGFEWDEFSSVFTGEKGVLVDVEDEEDGEHVQIYVD